ncbi:MAG: rod shape-determining protein MreD [Planctomycetes bacterium]|nr:rod shape-determining protein MreD [Planctomycetota bacterium]
MRWLSFTIILLVATILEAGNLLNLLAVGDWHIRPYVLVTLLVYYALVYSPSEAINCCFLIGFAADLSSGLLGPHIICYGLAGILLNQSASILTMKRATHKALFVFFTFMATEIAAYWLEVLKTHDSQPHIYWNLFLTAIYSAILCPFIWSVLSSLSKRKRKNHSRSQRIY